MMKDGIKLAIAGGVAVALVTAFGLHAKQLASLPKPTGQAVSGVLGTAETGTNQS
jgi:hypothetical protein